mgnify:CR=1 FL=1
MNGFIKKYFSLSFFNKRWYNKKNSLDTQTAVVYNEPAVKEVIEEFDFVITFEELVARQYENLASIQQEVTGNFEIDM